MKDSRTLTAADIAQRFGIKLSKAHRVMRGLPHVKIGRDLFTTEELLAGWMAANVKNPPRPQNFDPLMQAAHQIAVYVVEELVRAGKLQIAHAA